MFFYNLKLTWMKRWIFGEVFDALKQLETERGERTSFFGEDYDHNDGW